MNKVKEEWDVLRQNRLNGGGGEEAGERLFLMPLCISLARILTLNHHSEPGIIFPKNLPDIPAISALLNYCVVQA